MRRFKKRIIGYKVKCIGCGRFFETKDPKQAFCKPECEEKRKEKMKRLRMRETSNNIVFRGESPLNEDDLFYEEEYY